jgi:hypothetical protein
MAAPRGHSARLPAHRPLAAQRLLEEALDIPSSSKLARIT